MNNNLSERYRELIWSWTWARLKADRLEDIENRFGKKFTEWAMKEREKLTTAKGADSDIPIYSGSLGEIIALIDIDISALQAASSYVHDQGTPSSVWTITHNMNMRPSIVTVDSLDRTFEGEIEYIDDNSIKVTFNGAFSGKAYLS